MRSGLHGHPAKPIPGGRHEKRASHSTRGDADYDCIRVGEQVKPYGLAQVKTLPRLFHPPLLGTRHARSVDGKLSDQNKHSE